MPPESVWIRFRSWDVWLRWAVFVWCVILLVLCTRSVLQPRKRNLYLTWMTAGSAWLHGQELYPSEIPPENEVFRYGPTIAALFVPLDLMPESVGNVLWRVLNAGALLIALAWWLQSAAPIPLSPRSYGLIGLGIAPLALGSLSNGQPNLLLTALLLAGLAAAGEERWNLAGLCVAGACVLKIYPVAIGCLLLVVYPRQFGPRWLLALILLALLPFCLQYPDYVMGQYGSWWTNRLCTGDEARRFWPEHMAYRDLWLLLRVWHVPISLPSYELLQLGSALGCALLCLCVRVQSWPRRDVLLLVWTLGSSWMMLCGPATESCTYILLAPSVVWIVFQAWRERWTWPGRALVTLGWLILFLCVLAGATPYASSLHGLALHPLGALVFVLGYLIVVVSKLLNSPALVKSQGRTLEVANRRGKPTEDQAA